MKQSEEFRKQVNELWKQAVDQLEEVKDSLTRSAGRFETDRIRLRSERDRLLKRLGEQTYRLANQGKFPVPALVRRTVDRLNHVIEGLVAEEGGGGRQDEASLRELGSEQPGAAKKVSKKFKAAVSTTARKPAKKATKKTPAKKATASQKAAPKKKKAKASSSKVAKKKTKARKSSKKTTR